MTGRNYKWLDKNMLTPRQLKLYNFLKDYKNKNDMMPNFDEMKKYMKIKSKSGIFSMLCYMEFKQYIKRRPGSTRGIIILKEVA